VRGKLARVTRIEDPEHPAGRGLVAPVLATAIQMEAAAASDRSRRPGQARRFPEFTVRYMNRSVVRRRSSVIVIRGDRTSVRDQCGRSGNSPQGKDRPALAKVNSGGNNDSFHPSACANSPYTHGWIPGMPPPSPVPSRGGPRPSRRPHGSHSPRTGLEPALQRSRALRRQRRASPCGMRCYHAGSQQGPQDAAESRQNISCPGHPAYLLACHGFTSR
jgi:hypothetical protein